MKLEETGSSGKHVGDFQHNWQHSGTRSEPTDWSPAVALPESVRAYFDNRPVLVTGGMGFLGSNLTHSLVRLNARVTVLDNQEPKYGANPFNLAGVLDRVELLKLDQVDEKALHPIVGRFETIFNLAGQVNHLDSMEDPYADLRTNITAHVALLEACRKCNRSAKILYAGTRGQYGRPGSVPVDEAAPIAPVDANGVSKHAGEMYHFLYARSYGLRVCSLRLTNTYGPRHTMRTARQGVFAWFIRQALDGEEIRLYGDGRQLRDFNHVDDVVAAFLRAMASDEANGLVFNLGSRTPVSIARMAGLIVAAAGNGTIKEVPYPESLKSLEIGDYWGDHGKIRRRLGWEPRVFLEEGVAQTVAFYTRFRDRYWTPELYP
jgi:UDP-glucose 4-epimerase